jgi:hypothetical protein
MKLSLLVVSMFVGSTAMANESEYEFDLGLSMGYGDNLLAPKNVDINSELVPSVSLGLSKTWYDTQDWQFSSRLAVQYTNATNVAFTKQEQILSADIENTGLWADGKLAYTGFSDSYRPFVTLGVGAVYGNYEDESKKLSGWGAGVRAVTGFEFDLSKDASFNIGLGVGEHSALD